MWLKDKRGWRDDALDPWLPAACCRVAVWDWITLGPVLGAHLSAPIDPRRALQYAALVGPWQVMRKARSRWGERDRARAVVALVRGHVVEGKHHGRAVLAIATRQPACAERIITADAWVWPLDTAAAGTRPGPLRFRDASDSDITRGAQPWRRWAGWSPYAGVAPSDADALEQSARALWRALERGPWQTLPGQPTAPRERVAPFLPSRRPTAALFGYGHYARTCLLPTVRLHFDVRVIHELDPGQRPAHSACGWDTSPWLRDDERPRAVFGAGFHHTHGPLATAALARGAAAVIEKPLLTTPEQLDALADVMRDHPKLWIGYHKRYARESALLREDLRLAGALVPCHYRVIAHEIRLPAQHWYRWPSSRSRVLSNACHWIDHFLWLQGHCEVQDWSARCGPGESLALWIGLTNGATFHLSLGDEGSDRLGTRELIEVACGDRTARIIDGARYIAEDDRRVLRTARLDRMAPYPAMYDAICQAILRGAPGEPLAHVLRGQRLMLAIDAEVLRQRAAQEHHP